MHRGHLSLWFAAGLAGALSLSSTPVLADGAPPTLLSGRLPATATPERYSLDLSIDPRNARFSGVVTIQVALSAPSRFIALHARDLHIVTARVVVPGGATLDATTTMRPLSGGVADEELVLAVGRTLGPGTVLVQIAYDAPYGEGLSGLYRVEERDNWYAITSFEPTDARTAFPCFDEPARKTPFDVTITTPTDMMAVSNAPLLSTAPSGSGTTYRFQTTRPLPSYLLAFAVGDFDVQTGPPGAAVPIRVIAPKGSAHEGAGVIPVAAALIASHENYFGVRYPYEKLDLLAAPGFAAGAMENPGLIAFRQEILLVDGPTSGVTARRTRAEYLSHELAHFWFGDLVSPAWWDDTWLNEGFATWAEGRALDRIDPKYSLEVGEISDALRVMDEDALPHARAVRQPVRTTSDARDAFDGVTYQKGAAILSMLESWLGEDVFRRGVQRYLREHAWGSAMANDLISALEYVSARNVHAVANGLLDAPGVPRLSFTRSCRGARGGLSLKATENEWRAVGQAARSPHAWSLPVCVEAESIRGPTCGMAGANSLSLEAGQGHCPRWFYPNARSTGYFRVAMADAEWRALGRNISSLDERDRVGFVSNLWAAVRAGEASPRLLLDLLPLFDRDRSRFVVHEVVAVLRAASRSIVEPVATEAFNRYVTARLRDHKRRLGWEPGAHETGRLAEDVAAERSDVLRALGSVAHDEETLREAESYAARWFANKASVPSDVVAAALELGAIRGGADYLDKLRQAASSGAPAEQRAFVVRSMGAMSDPGQLARVFGLMLTGEVPLAATHHLVRGMADYPTSQSIYFAWVKANWGALTDHFSGELRRSALSPAAAGLCDASQVEDAKSFLMARLSTSEGATRVLDSAIETDELCVALRRKAASAATTWLLEKR